eukprot:2929261-Prymnesium_polylepis.1
MKEARSQLRRPNGRLDVCGGRLMLKASREKAICMDAREELPGAPRRSATHDHLDARSSVPRGSVDRWR